MAPADFPSKRPAAFFDRDGVLNEDAGYVHRIEDLVFLPGAVEAVRMCNEAGYLVFVVTNQAGVARGYYDEPAVEAFHKEMRLRLERDGARIDDFRYCPHHPDGTIEGYRRACDWRKPAPGMLLSLIQQWNVDPAASFLIGDRESDLEAGRAAGVAAYLFEGGPLDTFVGAVLKAKTDQRGTT